MNQPPPNPRPPPRRINIRMMMMITAAKTTTPQMLAARLEIGSVLAGGGVPPLARIVSALKPCLAATVRMYSSSVSLRPRA